MLLCLITVICGLFVSILFVLYDCGTYRFVFYLLYSFSLGLHTCVFRLLSALRMLVHLQWFGLILFVVLVLWLFCCCFPVGLCCFVYFGVGCVWCCCLWLVVGWLPADLCFT